MSIVSISAAGDLIPKNIDVPPSQVLNLASPSSSRAATSPAALPAELEGLKVDDTQRHVIVIGAGISGLRAASVLQMHGIRVTVLEGNSERIGGRILTSRKSGTARDIGKYA